MTTHRVLVCADVARRCGVERDAELPCVAWPGGYPLVYLDEENLVLCPRCANLPSNRPDIVAVDVHWEGEPLVCDECGALVESAYGPLEEVCDEHR